MSSTHRMVYFSRSLINGDLGKLSVLQQQCIENNQSLQISGALFYGDDTFFQVLEGETEDLSTLMNRIRADDRHHQIIQVSDMPVDTRLFMGWAMKFVSGLLDPDRAGLFHYEALLQAEQPDIHACLDELLAA